VYVGIYSPSRRNFEVSIPGGALLSNPTSQAQQGRVEQPLDVVIGDATSRLRNFEVGFGVLRGFRAEAPADAPQIESRLRLSGGKLQGEITNRSDRTLENIGVLYGGAVAVVAKLDPGQTHSISLDTSGVNFWGSAVSERIFGSTFPREPAEARTVSTRRAVLDQLFPYGSATQAGTPLLLAWRDGPVLDVQLAGDRPNRVGDGLFMIPLAMELDARQVFGDLLMQRTIVDSAAAQGWAEGSSFYLSRGTMTVEARPSSLAGRFAVDSLEIAITQGEMRPLSGRGAQISPLPDDQQPDQEDPLLAETPDVSPGPSGEPAPSGEPQPFEPPVKPGFDNMLPDFQLFDRVDGRWLEFAHPEPFQSYLIADPERYVDERGAVLFRFVNRSEAGQFGEEQRYFSLSIRLEGVVE
jgi:hypothetical protein